VDAHHLLIQAVVESYNATTQLTLGSEALLNAVINFVGITSLLALQIAAPLAGVSLIIDISASLINRAVPQTQPFLLALPAKLGLGMLILAASLPAVAMGVDFGVDAALTQIRAALAG
jgi:flagellar biosynthetic protein FliR